MVSPAVVAALLSAAVAVVSGLVAANRFAATGARPYGPLALASVALAALFLAGTLGDYFRPAQGAVLAAISFLAAAALLVGRSRST